MHSVYFVDEENGWAVGSSGTIISTRDNTSSVSSEQSFTPREYQLFQNYPNPFNPATKIRYEIVDRSYVTLKVYDVLGNDIAILVNEEKPAGTYEVEFDGTGLPSGIYIYRLQAGDFVDSKKMILLK